MSQTSDNEDECLTHISIPEMPKIDTPIDRSTDIFSITNDEDEELVKSTIHPVKSWKATQHEIKSRITAIRLESQKSRKTTSNTSKKGTTALSADQQQQNAEEHERSLLNATTIPYGFHKLRTYPHRSKSIRSVLYIPSTVSRGIFVSLDDLFLNVWKGSNKVQRISTSSGGEKRTDSGLSELIKDDPDFLQHSKKNEGDEVMEGNGLYGITKWIYHEKFKIYVVATERMELKLLDFRFTEIYTIQTMRYVLSLIYVEGKDEIICGMIGSIEIWKICPEMYQTTLVKKHEITEFDSSEWVYYLHYNEPMNILVAAVDSNVYIYDYATLKRTKSLTNIHNSSITCVAYYSPMSYLITAGKNGQIKVWNSQKSLICAFNENTKAITQMVMIEESCGDVPGTIPVVLCCSLDGTVRMFNFETGVCSYRLDTHEPCLGMAYIKDDTFYHYSKTCIYIWSLNRYQYLFSHFLTQPIILRRISHPTNPARILSVASDGSIKLLNSVTGNCIITGFPHHRESKTVDVVYDLERIYVLTSSNEIITYDSRLNPCNILGIWEYNRRGEKMTCITGIDLVIDNIDLSLSLPTKRPLNSSPNKFFLIVGNNLGQFKNIDYKSDGKDEFIIQAHSDQIISLEYDAGNSTLLSFGKDMLIKTWKVSYKRKKVGDLYNNYLPTFSIQKILQISSSSPTRMPKFIAFNKIDKIVALPQKHFLEFCSYETNAIHKMSEENLNEDDKEEINHACFLKAFDIWASSSNDSTIKIWGTDGHLIREIQFNEPISAFCFCNEKGDLLVSLSDQISIVKLQDYMPIELLKSTLTKNFVDDVIETPFMFDSYLDFWGYHYEESLNKENWHIDKLAKPPPEKPMKITHRPPLNDDLLKERRKQRRIFFEREYELYVRAKEINKSVLLAKQNPEVKLDELDQMFFDNYLDQKEMGIDNGQSKEVSVGANHFLRFRHQNSGGEHSLPTGQLKLRFHSSEKLKMRAKVPEEIKILTLEAELAILTKKNKLAELAAAEKIRQNKAIQAFNNPTVHKKIKKKVELIPEIGKDDKKKKKKKKIGKKKPRVAVYANSSIMMEILTPEERLKVKRRIKEAKEEEEENKNKPAPKGKFVARKRLDFFAISPDPNKSIFDDMDDDEFNEVEQEPVIVDKSIISKKKSKRKSLTTPPISIEKPVYTTTIKEEVVEEEIIKPSLPKVSEPRIKLDTNRKESVVKKVNTALPVHQKQIIPDKPSAKPLPDENDLLFTIDFKEASKYVWKLLRQQGHPELTNIMRSFQFPHGNKINLYQVLKLLLEVLNNGSKTEKCESIKALLYLYNVFQNDFMDPLETLITPLLKVGDDPDWEVRAQVLSTILGYGVNDSEILRLLVRRLADENGIVRKIAIQCLARLGINSKLSLLSSMETLNLYPNHNTLYTKNSILDLLLHNLHKLQSQKQILKIQKVSSWLTKTDFPIHHSRRDSYFEHLVPPLIPSPQVGEKKCWASTNLVHLYRSSFSKVEPMRAGKVGTGGGVSFGEAMKRVRPLTAGALNALTKKRPGSSILGERARSARIRESF